MQYFDVQKFGQVDGQDVHKITINNDAALLSKEGAVRMSVLSYGCIQQSLETTDKDGKLIDVVLGFDNIEGYQSKENPYFGAIVGRYANRLSNGQITVGGKEYKLTKNERDVQTLHGGKCGWDKKVWKFTTTEDEKHCKLNMTLVSPHLDEGFPATVLAEVQYTVCKHQPKWKYSVKAEIDNDSPVDETVISMTNHAYFNLNGHDCGDVLKHEAMIAADEIVEVDAGMIPTGKLLKVDGTAFEFHRFKTFGERIDSPECRGYDHCFKLKGQDERQCALFRGDKSNITMMVSTTQPGGHLYTGNWIEKTSGKYKKGQNYGEKTGFAFEVGNFPDAPNQPGFPSAYLKKGEKYDHKTEFEFTIY